MRSANPTPSLPEFIPSPGERSSPTNWPGEFVPRKGARSGDAQTLLAAFLPRRVQLPHPEHVIVTVDPATNSRVLCHCNWQPKNIRSARMTMLLVHGLEGSSQSQYMLGNAGKAWHAGWNVIRMNMRNCGGTERLSPTLYHSGLSTDVTAVAEHFVAQHRLQQMSWVGYSMGGNLVIKAAGECGNRAPQWLRAVVGVSPVVDLAPSADALHHPRNRVYEWNFLRNMLGRYRRKAILFPGSFSLANCKRVRSIRNYDEYIVSPNCGFLGADDYYHRASSARVIDSVAAPTLILHALDDPFIRILPETGAKIMANPHVTFLETKCGGHCGFLASPSQTDDGYWAESTLHRFIESHALPLGDEAG